jgi:DNA-binding Xre family transcriptional regulator
VSNVKFNHSKLLGRIREKGYTQHRLAEDIGMNPGTMSLKLNNGSRFATDEIDTICEKLDIAPCDIGVYFFAK